MGQPEPQVLLVLGFELTQPLVQNTLDDNVYAAESHTEANNITCT